jgi:hypothetical protein
MQIGERDEGLKTGCLKRDELITARHKAVKRVVDDSCRLREIIKNLGAVGNCGEFVASNECWNPALILHPPRIMNGTPLP